MRALLVSLFALGLLAAAIRPAHAHTKSISHSTWITDGNRAEVTFRASRLDLTAVPAGAIAAHLTGGLRLRDATGPCPIIEGSFERLAGDAVDRRFSWRVRCVSPPVAIESAVLVDQIPGHIHAARIRGAEVVLDSQIRVATWGADPMTGALDWLRLGVSHVLVGWDHLVFLLTLVVLVPRPRDSDRFGHPPPDDLTGRRGARADRADRRSHAAKAQSEYPSSPSSAFLSNPGLRQSRPMTHVSCGGVLVPRRCDAGEGPGGSIRRIAWLVTGFTLGHCLSLAVAALGWVEVDATAVEVAIGLTIVVAAAENVWRNQAFAGPMPAIVVALIAVVALAGPTPGAFAGLALATACYFALLPRPGGTNARLAITSMFGLIHGLGFASAVRPLADGPLGTSALVSSLIAFNVGVELAQIAFVAVAFGCTELIVQRRAHWRAGLVEGSSAVAAGLGVCWVIGRLG